MLFKKNQLLVFLFTTIFSSFTFSQITCNDTPWNKALDFSGGAERCKQVSSESNYQPLQMGGLAETVGSSSTAGKTSNYTVARPWATAIVFKADRHNSNQHIWNQGEGASDGNDNIYLRLTAAGSLMFGWGREGDGYNEVRIANQNISSSTWYGVYITSTGERLSGDNASAANLADIFDIRIMSSADSFNTVGSNLSTSSNWTSTGARMDRAVTGDFTIGGRGSNRSFHGKVASMVITTLLQNDPMPTDAEIKLMITDPQKWEDDYKIGQGYRIPNNSYTSCCFQNDPSSGFAATQIWLMGDGQYDAFATIRNDVRDYFQSYTPMNMISMQSNDI
jgi:hypothetical protein